MNRFYQIFGIALLLLYAVVGFAGWEFSDTKRELLPPSVRNAPGGYRSFHFWHSGYSGGK
jgi:hypothetical protein